MRKPSYNKDGSFKEWKWIKKPKWNDEVEEEESDFVSNMQQNLEYQMKLRGIK